LIWGIALGAVVLAAAVLVVPRLLIARAQDRLAAKTVAREGGALKLLTRAELVAGRYRRMPGVLAFREAHLEFQGVHGDSLVLPMERVQKIATGKRLASGRLLFRQEALRLTRTGGDEVELVVSHASAHAWRSHLGLWAGRERETAATADRVSPGRG
jgi:hypothetical protein